MGKINNQKEFYLVAGQSAEEQLYWVIQNQKGDFRSKQFQNKTNAESELDDLNKKGKR